MKTVLLCNRLDRLTATLKDTSGPLHYVSLTESAESGLIRKYLEELPGAEELPRPSERSGLAPATNICSS